MEAPRIGRYAVLKRLGEGGMAVVYAAYDHQLDRRVALKLMRLDAERASGRMLREAQALAKLSHPNIVPVFEVGEHQGELFIAMEFIKGQTLREWRAAEQRTWRDVVEKYVQAGRGLSAAHDVGLVHRDFKPDNAVVGDDGRVRVLDFGLVRRGDEPSACDTVTELRKPQDDALATSLTATGMTMGTPAYMAPEQFLGDSVDARTDQFSFCVALWEALYGQRPFAGSKRAELMANVTQGNVETTVEAGEVPDWLRRVLEQGVSPQLSDRFDSMSALLAALNHAPPRAGSGIAVATVAAVVVGIGTLGVVELHERGRAQACRDEGASISEIWNDDARKRVELALLATELPYAETAWAGVNQRLTQYANSWRSARTNVCRSAGAGQMWTREHQALAKQCFDDRASTAAALVEVLSEADAQVAVGSVAGAAALEPVDACTTRASLARQIPLPAPGPGHEQIIAARKELSRAKALWLVGNYQDGLMVSEHVLAKAEALDDGPLRAETLLLQGMLREREALFDQAEEALEAAYFLAVELEVQSIAAEAAQRLVWVVGRRLYRIEDGLVWAKIAENALPEDADDLGRSHLLMSIGSIHRVRGEYDEAATHYARALDIQERRLGRTHPTVASSLASLGSIHRDRGSYDQAIEHLARAVSIFRETLGSDHPQVAMSLNNLGNVYLDRRDYDRAKQHFERALEIREALDPTGVSVSWPLRNLGRVHQALGEHGRAADYLAHAVAMREEALGHDHLDVAFALASLGNAHFELGEYHKATETLTRALAIFEDTVGLDNRHTARVLSSMGKLAAARGAYDEATAYEARALAIFDRALGSDHPQVASSLHRLSTLHREWGDRGRTTADAQLLQFLALNPKRQAVAFFALETALGPEHPLVADALVQAGRAETARDHLGEAIELLERALAIRSKSPTEPAKLAEARSALARALWEASPEEGQDHVRARELAEEARDGYAP